MLCGICCDALGSSGPYATLSCGHSFDLCCFNAVGTDSCPHCSATPTGRLRVSNVQRDPQASEPLTLDSPLPYGEKYIGVPLRSIFKDASYMRWMMRQPAPGGTFLEVLNLYHASRQQQAPARPTSASGRQQQHTPPRPSSPMQQHDIVQFGEYSGQPAAAVLADAPYICKMARLVRLNEEAGVHVPAAMRRLFNFVGSKGRRAARRAVHAST